MKMNKKITGVIAINILISVSAAPLEDYNPDITGQLTVNKNYRPILMKYNGGSGIYGSEIGFNAKLDTQVVPNQFIKLGGTSQHGGASIVVDHSGNMLFKMYDADTNDEVSIDYAPQIRFRNNGKVGIGGVNPTTKLEVKQSGDSVDEGLRVVASGSSSTGNLFMQDNLFKIQRGGQSNQLVLDNSGNVGIGTTSLSHKLSVNGTIRSKEVIVETGWSDFVFEDGYDLRSLDEVEDHIEEHGHLPDVPSASVVESEGLSVGEVQKIMMQKIEELTLYVIDLDKEVRDLKAENSALKEMIGRPNL